jgi:hypothetical protein
MENFFSYISKPIDKEDLQIWIDSNNICYNKFELYNDFVISLIGLINDTYLGNDTDRTTNIRLEDEDNKKHFDWCWDKLIENFSKEGILFNSRGEHYDFFDNFIFETFYNQQIHEVKFSLTRFFEEIFNLNGLHTMSDLDLLKTIYKSLDKNLENNNLHN